MANRLSMDLQELNNHLKELPHLIRTQEKRANYHKTKAEQLTIAFLLLTSVFFFSISQSSSSLQCNHWWMPFTFLLLSSLIYFVAFVDALVMFYRIQYQADLTHIEQQLLYSKIHQTKSHSIQIGDSSCAKNYTPPETAATPFDLVEIIEPDVVQLIKRKVFIFLTISVLAGFTLVMLYACRVLLCDGDSAAA